MDQIVIVVIAIISIIAIVLDADYKRTISIKKANTMKREEFEKNKEHRKVINKFEEFLVKLEDEYGCETGAPFVTTVINETAHVVLINGNEVSTLSEVKTYVKSAEKEFKEIVPELTKVPDMEVKVSPNNTMYNIEFKLGNVVFGPYETDRLGLKEKAEAIERHILDDFKKHMINIKEGVSYYEAAKAIDSKIAYANEALRAFKYNADAKRRQEETGVYEQRINAEYPWSGFTDVRNAITQFKHIQIQYYKRSKILGFEYEVIQLGQTYIKEIGAENTTTSHPQRTAALRLGKILGNPIEITVDELIDNDKYKVTLKDGTSAIAVLKLEDNDMDFYIKTFMPIKHMEYFKDNEFYDEVYQDDLEVSLEELVNLNLWLDYQT